MDMLLTGRNVPAEEAKAMGLASHVAVGDAKEEALSLAKSIAQASGYALRVGKQTFYAQTKERELKGAYRVASKAMAENSRAPDCKEGIDAFFEKRIPEWKQ